MDLAEEGAHMQKGFPAIPGIGVGKGVKGCFPRGMAFGLCFRAS